MTGETAWIDPSARSDSSYAAKNFRNGTVLAPGSPLLFDLWWPRSGEHSADLAWNALRASVAAVTIALAAWCYRARLRPGWAEVVVVVVAGLLFLGPIRFAESTSTEVSSCCAAILRINRAMASNHGRGRG